MTRLEVYLALEKVMMALGDADDSLADEVRDVMDGIWHGLSVDDRKVLDNQQIVTGKQFVGEGLTLTVGDSLWTQL